MNIELQIKQTASELGFSACGIAKTEEIISEKKAFENYLNNGFQGKMTYLERNQDKRFNPSLLMEDAKSVIVVLQNYYANQNLPDNFPYQIARFARGGDYHSLIKGKLNALAGFLTENNPNAKHRVFVDTAPVLEKYWAKKAGLGWIGKNGLLINPEIGSFCNIGVLLTTIDLEPDKIRVEDRCGSCTACMEKCPEKAIVEPHVVNPTKCIAYHTIENSENLDVFANGKYRNCYGCDICQDVCPWNKKLNDHATLAMTQLEVRDLNVSLSEDRRFARFLHSRETDGNC